jgi:hypothetical protein
VKKVEHDRRRWKSVHGRHRRDRKDRRDPRGNIHRRYRRDKEVHWFERAANRVDKLGRLFLPKGAPKVSEDGIPDLR